MIWIALFRADDIETGVDGEPEPTAACFGQQDLHVAPIKRERKDSHMDNPMLDETCT